MVDLIVNNFWAIAAALLMAVFGGYVAWRNGHKSRHATACANFRASVLRALEGLHPHHARWPADDLAIDPILRAAFPAFQAAVAEFRPFVPWWQRRAFDRAWFQYHCSTGRTVDAQVYHHYMAFSDQPDPKVTFHENITRLLHFANAT